MTERLQQWPGYTERQPRKRVLAMLKGYRILSEHGDVWYVRSWASVKELLFREHLELYVTDLPGSWWFADAIRDSQAKVLVPSTAIMHSWNPVTAMYVKEGRHRGWILSSRAWNTPTVSFDFLHTLRTLFDSTGVGERPTPGSLGQALMRQYWQQDKRKWVSRPYNQCRRDLLAHSLGGRVDYYVSPITEYAEVYEQDLTGAYASVVDRLPGGHCVSLHREPVDFTECVTYFMECRITIPDDIHLVFGVFGIKSENGTNVYPTESGRYTAWLWKEEIEQCRRLGIVVQPCTGWGWTNWNSGLARWARHMFQLRSVLGSAESVLGKWIKQAIVSSLGRFGMPLWQWSLLPESSPLLTQGDMGLSINNQETGLVLHRVAEWSSNHLTHWYSYLIMRCRLVLRARMQMEYDKGNPVLASNYDAVYTLLPAEAGSLGAGLGEWKQSRLTGVRFPFPRGLISNEKRTLPGVKGGKIVRRLCGIETGIAASSP